MGILSIIGDRTCVTLSLLSTLLCFSLILAFAVNNKVQSIKALGLFNSNPDDISKKYYIDIAPGKTMTLIGWPIVLGSKILAAAWLIKMGNRGTRVFRKEFYLDWIASMILTIMWIFHYDQEQHIINVPVVGLVCFLSYRGLAQVAQRLEATKADLESLGIDPLSAKSIRLLKLLVIPSSVFHSVWATTAMMSTIAYPIAYAPSSHVKDAIPMGILSVGSCSTIGLWYMILFQMCYTALDLTYGRHTEHIKVVHPSIIAVITGTYLSNYHSDKGITENNMMCLLIASFSIAIYSMRSWISKMLENRKKTA